MFFTEPYTAKKETIIKMKLRPVHQNGTKNSNGVTIQWIKHKVDEAAPKMSANQSLNMDWQFIASYAACINYIFM